MHAVGAATPMCGKQPGGVLHELLPKLESSESDRKNHVWGPHAAPHVWGPHVRLTPTRRALPCVQLTCVRAWQVVARRLGLPCRGYANGLPRRGYANNALGRNACDAFVSILTR